MGKCKTKYIQIELNIFKHNQAYPELFTHIQAYSEACVTLAHLKPRYIQNPDIFKISGIFITLSNIYEEEFRKNSWGLYLFSQYKLTAFSTS